jgi:O-antigen/teichoic acid export membrane protein
LANETPQPASLQLSELRDRILGGAFRVGASQVPIQGVRFVGLLVLVRILLPGDFGPVAMCFVVTVF